MSNKKWVQKVCKVLNYIEHLLILVFTVTGYLSISYFASLAGITIGITSSAIGLKAYVITSGMKKYNSIIKKKKKWHDKILSLANYKINRIKYLISKALIDSNIIQDEFISIKTSWKNLMIWQKKSKVPITNKSLNYI